MPIGTTAIELRVFKKKKKNMDKIIGKAFLDNNNIHIWCSFTEILGILFSFHIFSAIKLLRVKMT